MASWKNLEVLARARLPELLAGALGVDVQKLRVTHREASPFDLTVRVGGQSLLAKLELGGAATSARLPRWQTFVQSARSWGTPLIVVAFMPEPARVACLAHGINWLDLSGNARIRAEGLHVRIDGQPNLYARRGRPRSVFERRSARLTRQLLLEPTRAWTVRECAKASGLAEGHASRVLTSLIADGLLARKGKRLEVAHPQALLDAWRDASDFSKHRILRGHVPARSGEELLGLLPARLAAAQLEHAATGLAGAWLHDHFTTFRLATFFVRQWPSTAQLDALELHEEADGANVWLVLPVDDGVFEGASLVEGLRCAHPVQVYVDLAGQPERAKEASEHLRAGSIRFG